MLRVSQLGANRVDGVNMTGGEGGRVRQTDRGLPVLAGPASTRRTRSIGCRPPREGLTLSLLGLMALARWTSV